MLKINNLRVEILSDKSENIEDLYGFDYTFHNGLNIVAGPNSRGKTTINSCIYYCLGMEELLGAQNEKSLDKALKEEFTIKTSEEEKINHNIVYSKVFLEIENQIGEKATLERYIKINDINEKTSNIIAYESDLQSVLNPDKSTLEKEILYVNGQGNNENPNGFYFWLEQFINLEIPEVSNNSRTSNYSPLYLQTVFSALFIEQTKGWSDFFATMPFFGITKAKEKIVEFLLDLHEIKISTQKDIIFKKRQQLQDEWKKKIKAFNYIENQSNAEILNIPGEITKEKSKIDQIVIVYSTSEDEKISSQNFIIEKEELLIALNNEPLSKVKETREKAVDDYNKEKEEYAKLKDYIDNFERKYGIEKIQLRDLSKQLDIIEEEIKDNLNLQKVFKKNIINDKGANQCPTCTQEVSIDLLKSKDIQIPQLSIQENTNFLRSQRKIIKSSILSLEETVKEKELLLSYFKDNLRKKESLIKSISKDLIADDRAFSESELVRKLQLEKEIEQLKWTKQAVSEIKKELEALAVSHYNNDIELGTLVNSEKEDNEKINLFEDTFKDLLFQFGYDSNEKYKISINRKEPFKYFPVYKKFPNDPTPQSIRINSSASDFVRTIWAFTISLLEIGENHPGLIIFDEPGQHRTNLYSLKALLKKCSKIFEKQVFIFTSIDKQLNEEEKIDLDELISGLEEKSYNLIRLDDRYKVIQKLL